MPLFSEEFSNDVDWRTKFGQATSSTYPITPAASGGNLVATFPGAYWPDLLFGSANVELTASFAGTWPGIFDFHIEMPDPTLSDQTRWPLGIYGWTAKIRCAPDTGPAVEAYISTTSYSSSPWYGLIAIGAMGGTGVAWDPAKQHYRIGLVGDLLSFMRSTDGGAYTVMYQEADTVAVPGLLTVSIQMFRGYPDGGIGDPRPDGSVNLDYVRLEYEVAVDEVTAAANARWDLSRNDIVGDYTGTRTRFPARTAR